MELNTVSPDCRKTFHDGSFNVCSTHFNFTFLSRSGFQRISRPSCGSYFDDDSQGTEIRVTREVFPEYTTYYRVIPQYFFRSRGTVTISVSFVTFPVAFQYVLTISNCRFLWSIDPVKAKGSLNRLPLKRRRTTRRQQVEETGDSESFVSSFGLQ